jgi:hypothetical protein
MTLPSIEFGQPTDARLLRQALGRVAAALALAAPSVDSFSQSRIAPTRIKGLPCAQATWQREAAQAAGALATVDDAAPDAPAQLAVKAGAPIRALSDLVGNAPTAQFGFDCSIASTALPA